MFSDGNADLLDAMADEHNRQREELSQSLLAEEERESNAVMMGVPLSMIRPTDTLWSIVQWICRYKEPIKKTIPLVGGRMTTKEEVVDTALGKYYLKTGWYTKDGISVHTLTPDEFILELVKDEVRGG